MLHVHHNGVGVAGVFTREVAESKIQRVERLAREQEFPLRLTMEPEEEEDAETWPVPSSIKSFRRPFARHSTVRG
jgi:hypothetical protein